MNVFYEEDGGFKVTPSSLHRRQPVSRSAARQAQQNQTAHVLKFTSPLADFCRRPKLPRRTSTWISCGNAAARMNSSLKRWPPITGACAVGHRGRRHRPAPAWRADVFLPQAVATIKPRRKIPSRPRWLVRKTSPAAAANRRMGRPAARRKHPRGAAQPADDALAPPGQKPWNGKP